MAQNSDDWRFADDVAKRLDKSVGVYGADVVPATTTRTTTGATTRGEELFARPELYRPWRAPEQQQRAAVVVGKEQEIEHLTRKNNELRTETASLQRELQRALQRAKLAEQGANEDHEREARLLRDQITELKGQLEAQKSSAEHQLRVVRSEHDAELKKMQAKVQLAQDGANESGTLYARQLGEVKAAASREVTLVQQLAAARAAELQNELEATKDSLRRLQERTAELISDSHGETRRTEDRCLKQLAEQEQRFDKMRNELHAQVQALETERDRLRVEVHEANEKAKSAEFDVAESEARFKDWNVRLLSDLDQLYEYYYAVVRDVRGGDDGVALVVNNDSESSSGTLKGVMERVADRLQQLTVLKQQHTLASQGLQKKIRSLEAAAASTDDLFRRTSEEKDVQLSRLYAEAADAKSRLQRLETAVQEVKDLTAETNAHLLSAAHRLQFFSDDLQTSLTHMGPPPVAPFGVVTFAGVHIDGAAVLWDADSATMQSALTICNDIVRAKIREFGGYEYAAEAGTMQIAFQEPDAAVRFALEAQEWLLRARWPLDLLKHHAAREELSNGSVVFRGLRVGITLHRGEAQLEETAVPVGLGTGRTTYFGKTVTQLMHLASFCSGGQIIASAPVWNCIRDSLSTLGTPSIAELGQHRIAVASRGADGRADAFSSSETVTLHQLLPQSLASRTFAREGTMDSAVSAGGIGISSHFSQMARSAVGAEVSALRSRADMIRKAVETLSEEVQSVGSSVTSLSCKVRDAQVNGRIYSQADIVAHVAAIDRIVARSDVIRRDVERVSASQNDALAAVKQLEEQVVLQTKVSMNDDEYKKKLDLINDRGNERLYELKLQSDHQIQQLRSALQKAESTISELKKQAAAAAANDTIRSNSIAGISAVTATKDKEQEPTRPRTASAARKVAPKVAPKRTSSVPKRK
uniref:Guanylate cyclase domain-containing protein n=1 Tax=Neobodo designis TaxID=312471 RepID=A0A7S1LQR0_NEODS